jgi:ribosome assembly protein 3
MTSKSSSNGHGHVNGNGNAAMEVDGQDEDKRTRFRRVYMETLVKGFGKDLEKIREVCPFSPPVP